MPKVGSKPSPKLADRLPQGRLDTRPEVPVWKGPSDLGPDGGVTQSMMAGGHGFMVCRERFRLHYIEGLRSAEGFSHRMEYGNMWHICEEAFAQGGDWEARFNRELLAYCQQLLQDYSTQQNQINQWYQICRRQFPIYVDHWKRHPDIKKRSPLLQEAVFDLPYTLPSGRVVRLRGKFDSVDVVGTDGVYLQENKAKGDIDQLALYSNLRCDFQTGMYMVVLREIRKRGCDPAFLPNATPQQIAALIKVAKKPLKGTRYNVIRRPLSGGKHSIRQLQGKTTKKHGTTPGETLTQFYDRLAGLIKGDAEFFFLRMNVEVDQDTLPTFERTVLVPHLEQLCDWYEHQVYCIKNGKDPFTTPYFKDPDGISCYYPHYMYPYGVYNVVNETGSSDLDAHIHTGSMVGLRHVNDLFRELK